MSSSYTKTRIMVECALMIALGTILANIKIYELPNGGSITLFSMVPFILVSFRHGVKWGLFTGFVNSLLQMLLGFYAPPAPGLLPLVGMILLDYVLAFGVMGIAGLGRGKPHGIFWGSVLGGAARFVVHYISGITIYKILAPTEIFGTVFDNPALYSLIYNGSYVGIDLVLCLVIFGILYAPLKTYMTGADLRR